MKGWILYKGKPVTELVRMQETAKQHGVDISIIDPSEAEVLVSDGQGIYVSGEFRPLPDFVLAGFVSNADYHNLSLLTLLETKGVLCVNKASTISKTKDKLLTLQILSQHDIPVPKTLLLSYPYNIEIINKEFGYPLVIKVIGGSKGNGVALIDNQEDLENMFQMFEAGGMQEDIILQEFIKSSKGRDIRVLITNYEAISAMIRSNKKPDGFKSNYSAGGQVEAFEITPAIRELTKKIASILDLNIGGIDLLFTENGFTVCEVNSMPGFEGMEKANAINVPLEILKNIAAQLSRK